MTLEPPYSKRCKEDLSSTDGGVTVKNLDRTTKTGISPQDFGGFGWTAAGEASQGYLFRAASIANLGGTALSTTGTNKIHNAGIKVGPQTKQPKDLFLSSFRKISSVSRCLK